MVAGIAGGFAALLCVGAMAFAYFKGRTKGARAAHSSVLLDGHLNGKAAPPGNGLRAAPSKKELASMKLVAGGGAYAEKI